MTTQKNETILGYAIYCNKTKDNGEIIRCLFDEMDSLEQAETLKAELNQITKSTEVKVGIVVEKRNDEIKTIVVRPRFEEGEFGFFAFINMMGTQNGT